MSLIRSNFLRTFQSNFIRSVQTKATDNTKKSEPKRTNNGDSFLGETNIENENQTDASSITGRERSLNRVQLIGRVGADPKIGGTEKHKVLTFNLATNEYAGTNTANGEIKQRVDWHRIAIFQPRLLENAEKYIRQGDRLYVQGRLHHNLIKDKNTGDDRYVANERTNISISQTAQNIPVDRIDSPYRINIVEDRSTLKDGVDIRIDTKIPCQLRVYWFVNIQQFYSELDSTDFRLSLYENRFLKENSIHQETFSFANAGEYLQHVQFSDAENYVMNNNQTRREYPLVLIVHSLIDESSNDFFQSPIHIATIHVKSSMPTDPPTNVLVRISKLSNGRSLVLQDIYSPGAFVSIDTCAVCLTERVTHVLLPCKHGCICQNCFSLVDKCPICQKSVISYFRI